MNSAPSDNIEFPKILEAVSLYCRDPASNTDKEYHLQIVQTDKDLFGVDFQYGRRGSNLKHGSKCSNTYLARAKSEFRRMKEEKTDFRRGDDQYHEFDFSVLHDIFSLLVNSKLGAAGANLFIQCGKKTVSMADYARAGGQAAQETCAMANAYGANAVSRRMMAETMGYGLPEAGVARAAMAEVEAMLHRASSGFGGYSPANLGVFLGHRDGNEIKPGLANSYWEQVGETPTLAAVAPLKKRTRAKP